MGPGGSLATQCGRLRTSRPLRKRCPHRPSLRASPGAGPSRPANGPRKTPGREAGSITLFHGREPAYPAEVGSPGQQKWAALDASSGFRAPPPPTNRVFRAVGNTGPGASARRSTRHQPDGQYGHPRRRGKKHPSPQAGPRRPWPRPSTGGFRGAEYCVLLRVNNTVPAGTNRPQGQGPEPHPPSPQWTGVFLRVNTVLK